MTISNYRFRPHIAGCLVMLLAVPLGEAAARPPQSATPPTQSAQSAPSQPQNSAAQAANPVATPASQTNPDNPPPAPEQQQNGTTPPLGTAAAPYQKTTGVPASRPAGAVIAPAKQRRSRSLLIRVGIIVGAAVAVGTVIGLSAASPSRPQ